ncbi:MAG TPA: 16S rRNA (cytosine(1402)-N(4))-methyltransferase RsmH [Anaerolineales bacterium]|nr:16S rRNA (cytosine(1402)-N(4))-methyltransferase RsmH [Anaerolineales bacterium]
MGQLTHVPVLFKEVIAGLQPRAGGKYIDGTVGAGGHAEGILAASAPSGLLLGLDRDPDAVLAANRRLASCGARATVMHAAYVEMARCAQDLGWESVDGILLDLGVSSLQFEQGKRGFSFVREGPLDMRFDPSSGMTAAEIVNRWPQNEIAKVLSELGEERQCKKIARALVQARPIESTLELARIIAEEKGAKKGKRHAATNTFQALRIAVNGELDILKDALPLALDILAPGGRLAVIAFHSLEDRMVKQMFRRESRGCLCSPEQIVCVCGHRASIREVKRRPIKPSSDEVTRNRRSRSARLRIAEKL